MFGGDWLSLAKGNARVLSLPWEKTNTRAMTLQDNLGAWQIYATGAGLLRKMVQKNPGVRAHIPVKRELSELAMVCVYVA